MNDSLNFGQVLLPDELAALREDVKGALRPAGGIGHLVTYVRELDGKTVNPTTGAETPKTEEHPINAARRDAEEDQGEGIQHGEYVFLVDPRALPFTPSQADAIVDPPGGERFNVERSSIDPTTSLMRVTCRREESR